MVNTLDYKRYIERTDSLIRDTLDTLECQPIFFIGSGISQRYLGTPSWHELLQQVANKIGVNDSDYSYIRQKFTNNPILIADHLQEVAFEWAWSSRPSLFDETYYDGTIDKSVFLKKIVCDILDVDILKNDVFLEKAQEVQKFRETSPHAIITTNYDNLIENIFDGYEAVIGEKVIKYNLNLVGEIFKIHGGVENANSVIINSADYDKYKIRKKYISAKLITYLTEHPVFIFGYNFGDPNINEIIEDVGEIIGKNGFIDNIFYVQWVPNIEELTHLKEEHVIGSHDAQYKVRAITTSDLDWVFKSISQERYLNPINTKVLRSLAARTYSLIRKGIPRRAFEVDYQTLESIVEKDEELPKLLGIAASNNPNISHPYTITQLGRKLGFSGWHGARRLLEQVAKETGVNICASDNLYHYCVKTGDKSKTSKYSKEAIEILRRAQANEPYELAKDVLASAA